MQLEPFYQELDAAGLQDAKVQKEEDSTLTLDDMIYNVDNSKLTSFVGLQHCFKNADLSKKEDPGMLLGVARSSQGYQNDPKVLSQWNATFGSNKIKALLAQDLEDIVERITHHDVFYMLNLTKAQYLFDFNALIKKP